MMRAKAFIGHQLENRVRIYLPELRGDSEAFLRIEKALLDSADALKVQTNFITGSILILHKGSWSNVIDFASKYRLFELDPTMGIRRKWTEDLFDKFSMIDRKINEASDGELSLSTFVALGLLGVSGFQISKRHFFPAASTLIADAVRILIRVKTFPAVSAKESEN